MFVLAVGFVAKSDMEDATDLGALYHEDNTYGYPCEHGQADPGLFSPGVFSRT